MAGRFTLQNLSPAPSRPSRYATRTPNGHVGYCTWKLAQVLPAYCDVYSVPSQSSPASSTPLPHRDVQPEVSKAQVGLHRSVPPVKTPPSVYCWQVVIEPRSCPSHCSLPSMFPSPQTTRLHVEWFLQSAVHPTSYPVAHGGSAPKAFRSEAMLGLEVPSRTGCVHVFRGASSTPLPHVVFWQSAEFNV